MNIDGIKTGYVLDHITAGKSMEIYKLLKLDRLSCTVALIQNARSTKYGKKDIIKIDELIDLNMDILGYMDPNITVITVKDNQVVKKEHLEPPKVLVNILKCKNPRCITSTEQGLPHKFYIANSEKRSYRCAYCDTERE